MGLTVLSVAYPFAPVSPDSVGGAEQVLSHIDQALVREGHGSIVVACEGSHVAGTLVSASREAGTLDGPSIEAAHARHRRAIVAALERWPIDVVHLHGVDFHRYLPRTGIPVLVTYHPAFLLPHRQPQRKRDVWEDMKMLLQRMGRPIPKARQEQ